MSLLNVQALSLTIGATQVLKSVSFDVAPGEILGIVGESGSGKSMTLLSTMRLTPRGAHASGAIRLDGEDLLAKSEGEMCTIRGQRIGMIFQEPMTALNPVQTIGHQVAEMFTLHRGLSAREAVQTAAQHLAQIGLTPDRVPIDRYPHQLSGGQRQRVVIAMATALSPKLVLADEPTTALDVTTQAGILDLLKALAQRNGAGLIFVTHDLAVVASLADRIAIMKQGEIVEEGPAPAIFRTMQHPYSKALRAAATLSPHTRVPKNANVTPILEAVDVGVSYQSSSWKQFGRASHTRAVDGISFKLVPGEVVGIVGESGSGKSTLARALLGIGPVTHGSVQIGGDDFATARGTKLRAIRQRIQVVFQDPYGSLNPRLRVEALIAEPLHLLDRRPSAKERRQRVETILARVGLTASDADKFPHEFSGGQRQRIAIARALILEPKIVVLDEAVSALDVSVRAQIIDLLRDLSERLGIAYLFITHDLSVVRALADRVLVMHNGRVVEEGPVAQVLAKPQHAYTQQLVAASPDLETALAERERTGVSA
ncbi:MAG: dipeptide ABC transporter ATP-binding protein [Alphaproteobacteria bacterium]|nr:dipeptide ABC transporter ATP-binding protein [Alphaproteobacteria bacterium]